MNNMTALTTEQYGKMMELKYAGKSHYEIAMVLTVPVDLVMYHLGGEKDRVVRKPH